MSNERTPDANIPPPLPLAPWQIEPSVCHVCLESMEEGADCLIIHDCSHAFHRSCIETHLSSRSECPECKRSCQLSELRKLVIVSRLTSVRANPKAKPKGAVAKHYNTRSSQRNTFPEENSQTRNMSNFQEQFKNLAEGVSNGDNGNIIRSPAATPPNARGIDYSEINRLIQDNLNRILGNLHLAPQVNTNGTPNNNQSNGNNFQTSPNCNGPRRQQTRLNGNNSYSISPIAVSNLSSSSLHGDKITSIIQNWNLKFDGSSTGLHVDEFLYRIRSLTKDNFNDDFNLICKNFHILLTGKARDWYWRYHKHVRSIQWNEFCDAIRSQYKEYKSSFDIREEVRYRKQRAGETFDVCLTWS